MAQAMLDMMKLKFNCNYCDLCCKSEAGLQNHMQKKHPLDVNSGLTCYTCNKIFSKRDLIENHFKTVKHQLECRRLKKEEQAEIAKIEENTYRIDGRKSTKWITSLQDLTSQEIELQMIH